MKRGVLTLSSVGGSVFFSPKRRWHQTTSRMQPVGRAFVYLCAELVATDSEMCGVNVIMMTLAWRVLINIVCVVLIPAWYVVNTFNFRWSHIHCVPFLLLVIVNDDEGGNSVVENVLNMIKFTVFVCWAAIEINHAEDPNNYGISDHVYTRAFMGG